MVERNLLLSIANLLCCEDHLAEAGELELLDDCRFVRQNLSKAMVKNEALWCCAKHLLTSYVSCTELLSKQVRNEQDTTQTQEAIGYLQKLIEKVCEKIETVVKTEDGQKA